MNPSTAQLEVLAADRDRCLAAAMKLGLETYDPYDFKGTPLLMGTYRVRFLGPLARKAAYGLAFVAPVMARKLLGVKKTRTAGGTAHLACALIERGRPEDLVQAKVLLQWLAQNPSKIKHPGKGWGLPFGWHSVKVVPVGTPIGHTTMTVGNAFWSYYAATQDPWALEEANLACRFLTEGLNRREHESGALSLSYTPLDESQCVNSNADIAALLGRVGRATAADNLVRDSERILAFVAESQNPDGSWYYMADDRQKGGSIIDGYHTGMILSALADGLRQGQPVLEALAAGTEFYLNNLISSEGWCRFAVDREYPLDAYSVGQALLTLSDLADCQDLPKPLRERCWEALGKVHGHSFRLMQAGDGRLFYRRYQVGAIDLGSLRWAQAITAWGLARASRFGGFGG